MAGAERKLVVGVLCLQGAFIEHITKLEAVQELKKDTISLKIVEVRRPEHLSGLDGLIVPGGESTTLSVFLSKDGFSEALKEWLKGSVTAWGTCAGLILFSDELLGQKKGGQVIIGGVAVESTRNLFGRQVNSFEGDIQITDESVRDCGGGKTAGKPTGHGVFIRAPGINKILSEEVKVLARLNDDHKTIVGVRHRNIMATCFHPELTEDLRWHCYFIDSVISRNQ